MFGGHLRSCALYIQETIEKVPCRWVVRLDRNTYVPMGPVRVKGRSMSIHTPHPPHPNTCPPSSSVPQRLLLFISRSSLLRTSRRPYPNTLAPYASCLEGKWWISTPGLSRAGGAGKGVVRRAGGIGARVALVRIPQTTRMLPRWRLLPCSIYF